MATRFSPTDADQIPEAILGAESGAAFFFDPGRFVLRVPLVLKQGVRLIGEAGKTILDAGGKHPIAVVQAKEQELAFVGLTFEGGASEWGGAIFCGAQNDVTIDLCRFVGNVATSG